MITVDADLIVSARVAAPAHSFKSGNSNRDSHMAEVHFELSYRDIKRPLRSESAGVHSATGLETTESLAEANGYTPRRRSRCFSRS